ncbi:MAG TPA: DUF721 domain-containing protein [Bacteroidia bacterium]|jgi:hypothetical protein|nr:DUF721 domain-containing protein [Bacteroidia bacterium]
MKIKKGNEYTIGEAIREMMQTYRLDGKLNELKILNSWEKVMGKTISKYTKKIYINNKILYVELESAALRQELSYAKTKVIGMLNAEAGTKVIEDIVLR